MSSWVTGTYEWGYWRFTDNPPYNAPLSFQVQLSTGSVVEGSNVITSTYSGSSGTISVSSAFTAEDSMATSDTTNGLSLGGLTAIVLSTALVCCMVGALWFVSHRKKDKVIAAGVEDEEVIGDTAIVEEVKNEGGYDMTPIDGSPGNTGDNEDEVMIEVPVTETVQ